MTIQRSYSLPNCKLVVEGLSEDSSSVSAVRPVLSRVLNAECHFLGQEQPLKGGRAFLESLSQSVSNYAQEFLSGVPHAHRDGSGLVQIHSVGPNLHRITVRPEAGTADGNAAVAPLQMDLKTVQLFDLVEAIDQFYADAQTLPDLKLNLSPLPKRAVVKTEPMTRQVVPAATGLAGLAVAAIALFFVPIPERRPTETTTETSSPTSVTSTPATSPAPAAPPTPVSTSPTPTQDSTPSPEAASLATPEATSSPAAETTPSPVASPLAELQTSNAPQITDIETIRQLNRQLRNTLDREWQTTPTFNEELVYRVSVARNGDILGFKYGNDAAINYVRETPLQDLQYNPVAGNPPEALAEYRVVFKPSGILEVSPWHGTPPQ